MQNELIIHVTPHETRAALIENGLVTELYMERDRQRGFVGNVYKGRVLRVLPGMQAAFVDIGLERAAFLFVADIYRDDWKEYNFFVTGDEETYGDGANYQEPSDPESIYDLVLPTKIPPQDVPIEDILKEGQEILVQVTKDPMGTKGPRVTMHASLPGRHLVFMPTVNHIGVSRRIEDETERERLKAIVEKIRPPQMGFIVRTAGVDRPKREMRRDLNYLLRLWKSTSRLVKTAKAPIEIYRESDLVIRTLRDAYSTDIARIVCDNPETAINVRDFLKVATPRAKTRIEVYTGTAGLFHDMGIDEEIDKINSRRVDLPSGGSLVIDPTEALVAVDVNSGRSRGHSNAEATALNTNLEAAREIGRQLRMRDLGGVIVMDFIDMRDEKHRRAVERELKEVMKGDRAKNRILRINSFGILQMTRQRLGPPLKHSYYRNCPQCDGLGMIKSEESQALVVMRLVARASVNEDVAEINITCPPQVAHYLTNYQRKDLILIEEKTEKTIIITADSEMTGDDVRIECVNARGSKIAGETGRQKRGKLKTVKLEVFLDEQGKKSESTKPTDGLQQTGDDSSEPSSSKKTSRRRRSKTAQKTAGTKEGTVAQAGKSAKKKTTDKSGKTTKTEKKTSDKPVETKKKKPDKPTKPAKSGKHRRRTSSKRTTEKTEKDAPAKASTEESDKKASKRTKKRKSARRKPSREKPAEDQQVSKDDVPAVTPLSQLREEIEARRLEQQKGKPPQKTLLEAMGFDDGDDK